MITKAHVADSDRRARPGLARRWAWLVIPTAGVGLFVALLGGVVALLAPGLLETLHSLGALPGIAVAVLGKAAELLIPPGFLLLFRRPVRLADGLILGLACGAGFAVLETLGHRLVEIIGSNENVGQVVQLLMQRGLLRPATDMAWTGLTATAFWYAAGRHRKRDTRPRTSRALMAVIGVRR